MTPGWMVAVASGAHGPAALLDGAARRTRALTATARHRTRVFIMKTVTVQMPRSCARLDQFCLPVHGHDRSPAEAEVVLERGLHAVHLALVRLAPQLPRQLRALGEPGRSQRVALGDQAARRVHDPRAAVGHGPGVDELARTALVAEAEGLVGDHLV